MPKFTTTIYLERGPTEREVAVEVTYTVTPPFAGTLVDPPCDLSVEVTSTLIPYGEDDLSEFELDEIYERVCEEAPGDLDEWDAEAAEYRAEMRAEALMLDLWEKRS